MTSTVMLMANERTIVVAVAGAVVVVVFVIAIVALFVAVVVALACDYDDSDGDCDDHEDDGDNDNNEDDDDCCHHCTYSCCSCNYAAAPSPDGEFEYDRLATAMIISLLVNVAPGL